MKAVAKVLMVLSVITVSAPVFAADSCPLAQRASQGATFSKASQLRQEEPKKEEQKAQSSAVADIQQPKK